MYSTILTIHSLVRWIALAAGVAATMAALTGSDKRTDRLGLLLMIALDVQMLLGLILYLVLSPYTSQAIEDFRAALQNPQMRFWVVEHTATMLGAVIVVHGGRVLVLKTEAAADKRTRRIVCFAIATVGMILGMPWPGLPYGRPLIRWSLG
ncbi:MAG: hypothetical protein A3G76_12705 [Acidobacteria bacterium RIFCSPLOWO2_12_FULL_65_11]|nr:MAG: hypothetical protein A3H95_06380 [Acidobacteria bacterium RIFCSPLOWO2_02_FULL_64_15]OFW31601.1 MAG: hypothetical protein A3G76_12705 [Acidobacteria bacterium RIFCSPLOWO2_12_FULL_65_11]